MSFVIVTLIYNLYDMNINQQSIFLTSKNLIYNRQIFTLIKYLWLAYLFHVMVQAMDIDIFTHQPKQLHIVADLKMLRVVLFHSPNINFCLVILNIICALVTNSSSNSCKILRHKILQQNYVKPTDYLQVRVQLWIAKFQSLVFIEMVQILAHIALLINLLVNLQSLHIVIFDHIVVVIFAGCTLTLLGLAHINLCIKLLRNSDIDGLIRDQVLQYRRQSYHSLHSNLLRVEESNKSLNSKIQNLQFTLHQNTEEHKKEIKQGMLLRRQLQEEKQLLQENQSRILNQLQLSKTQSLSYLNTLDLLKKQEKSTQVKIKQLRDISQRQQLQINSLKEQKKRLEQAGKSLFAQYQAQKVSTIANLETIKTLSENLDQASKLEQDYKNDFHQIQQSTSTLYKKVAEFKIQHERQMEVIKKQLQSVIDKQLSELSKRVIEIKQQDYQLKRLLLDKDQSKQKHYFEFLVRQIKSVNNQPKVDPILDELLEEYEKVRSQNSKLLKQLLE